MDHRSLVFASVFPVPSLSHTTPTPVATPDLGYTGPGQSFGGPLVGHTTTQHRAVKRNLAWSTATRFLSLPKSLPGINTSFEASRPLKTADVDEALHYLLVGDGKSEDGQEEGLIDWYTNEARLHFARCVQPALQAQWRKEIELQYAWDVLDDTQKVLQQAQALYLRPFEDYILHYLYQSRDSASTIRPAGPTYDDADSVHRRFRRDIHAIFAHCLPPHRFGKTLSYVLYDAGRRLFRVYVRHDSVESSPTLENTKAFRLRMTNLLQGLERIGLGGENAQKAFAHAMDKLMDSFIVSHYLKVDWYSKKSIVPHLRMWIKDGFRPLIELVMECLKCSPSNVQPTELQQWQEMALTRLGRARVESLFDFVIKWNHSLGAILDIKEYLKAAGAKQFLISTFSQQVSRRLLHPGATTTYILDVYIAVIRTFHEIEPKGVLLERVARPIRRYLKEREDTARIIISSLLTDINDDAGSKFTSSGELSYLIANEMQKPFSNFNQEADEDLNWGDMNWQPLPSDASPDYKKTKIEDVIWFLLTLWDREDFINELKNILGDHLLRSQDPEYEKEIRLLELIKVRLGDDKLQACEVMLRDVLDSKRINAAIRASGTSSQTFPQTPDHRPPETPEGPPRAPRPRRPNTTSSSLAPSAPLLKPPEAPTLNAQILSSFFWPLLRDDNFRVPAHIEALQKEYETSFERIKGMRKLRWMNALGEGAVTLEFEDRTQHFEKLAPWQVSVIYAFQPQSGDEWASGRGKNKPKDAGVTRNVVQLEDMLEMEEQLVRQALAFWVGQSVLRETHPDTYAVIEAAAPDEVDSVAAAAAQELAEVQAAQAGAVKSQSDLLQEKKDVYITFITAMLTNQGDLPVQRIAMMMKVMIPGFVFGPEEVKELLLEMEMGGKATALGGDVWGIRK
ncbi:anaphase-promoting complex subunit Apc2 [Lojkania enalia]|uniref:Anaphase-promoting complex subunit 2 n=1 Tax=Lojkania enalia TaxID=147567 RepID=A0A9P4KH69_9PLEO|nr:anaphase-promoting complex subunit Apc2 [Didymosphaeria enalia]